MSQVLNGNEQRDRTGDVAPGSGDAPAQSPASSPSPSPSGPEGRKPLTPQQKKIVVVAVLANTVIASFTWRDLRRRPASMVRGPKTIWRLWSLLNTSGSLAYWLVGRRRAPSGTTISIS